jgi:hypothetical protein
VWKPVCGQAVRQQCSPPENDSGYVPIARP